MEEGEGERSSYMLESIWKLKDVTFKNQCTTAQWLSGEAWA